MSFEAFRGMIGFLKYYTIKGTMRSRLIPLTFAAVVLATVHVPATANGGRTPVFRESSVAAMQLPVLFQASFPVSGIFPSGWTEAQKKEISYIRERMKTDSRIFLLIQATADPIGPPAESARWGQALALGIALRLAESGIPRDRLIVAPGTQNPALFDESDWGGFEKYQQVTIRGLQGGDWFRRPETPVVVKNEPLPPAAPVRILEPAPGKTDRANHVMRGEIDENVGTVAVAIGRETQTVAVYEGRFELPISLRPGDNRILVTALDRYGRALRGIRDVVYAPPVPSIDILSPAPGTTVDLSSSPVITVRGAIRSRNPLRTAYLIQNDFPRPIPVDPDGNFSQKAVVVTEEDTFSVEALDTADQTGISETRKVAARGIAERPLLAILHWDEGDVDVDLHVTDRKGNHTYFDAPDVMAAASAIPSSRLWLDNRSGFGPEVFSLERNAPGEYTFSAEHYRGKKGCRAYLTIVLFSGSPSRKMVRVFGPILLSPARRKARIVAVTLPSGTVRELTNETR